MPPDNAATVAPGTAVSFPQDGPLAGGIIRSSPSTFTLPAIGTYRVAFSVSVTEAGQLGLRLNGALLAYTVYGRATGTSEIVGEAFVTTTALNSILEVVNPAGNAAALTITPLAGGAQPVVASLTIERLG
jgi:BclA C-terminal domain